MPLATDIEIKGTDGEWRRLSVALALGNRRQMIRCVDCKGPVRLHGTSADGKQEAHAEHQSRWHGCPRSVGYDGQGLKPNPVQVT